MTTPDDLDLDLIFAALGDPTRRAILARLLSSDQTVGDLAAPLPMSLAAVSKHLGILVRAGLISQRQAGRIRVCRLEPDALKAAAIWMQGFGDFDLTDLDALERLIGARLGEDWPEEDWTDGERTDGEAPDSGGLDHPLGPGEVD